jgi:hypothetical protein
VAKSAAASDVVQSLLESHDVARAAPPIRIVEPGPGLEGTKLAPVTSNVIPPAAPAVALEGASKVIAAGVIELDDANVTVAVANALGSASLCASTATEVTPAATLSGAL